MIIIVKLVKAPQEAAQALPRYSVAIGMIKTAVKSLKVPNSLGTVHVVATIQRRPSGLFH